MSNVRVALRVRPLNKREEEQGAKIIVEVQGESVRVTNLKVPSYQEHDNRARLRQFNFDFCYWSVDRNSRRYASQEMIYQDLGSKVLEAVYEGFNACVFAYGQSGSGKTYTMMGYNGNLGLTPRICQGLFEKMTQVQDKRTTFRTEVSFLEIYNERVGDLLRPRPAMSSGRQRHTLRVREHPKFGPCVQDLSKHVVTDFDAVQALIEKGNQNRSVAATKMHDHSSRSHAIFTINFTQARLDAELPSEVVSKIHLVDLAGSERATAHTSKIRLKEGANINKSLVALGGVICALAERSICQCSLESSGSSRMSGTSTDSWSSSAMTNLRCAHQTSFVPYRDSVLTWLLKDSIGGNSKTIMVATISPASTAYNETISTLHYTQRAKRIVNKPIINEDPNVKLIRELKAEISRLRKMLSTSPLNGLVDATAAECNLPVAEIIIRNQDKAQELTRMWIEKWHYFQQQMQTLSCKSCAHRISSSGTLMDCGIPYLVGVSDIPSVGVQVFYLKEGEMVIGNGSKNGSVPDIVLSGDKIASEHCRLCLKDGIVTLTPVNGTVCYLNGSALMGAVKLAQGDIMHFANGNALRFEDPSTWKCVIHASNGQNSNELKINTISLDKHNLQLSSGADELQPQSDFQNVMAEESSGIATWDRCLKGMEITDNFNQILGIKMNFPFAHQVNCNACNQLHQWISAESPEKLLSKKPLTDSQVLEDDDGNTDSVEDEDSVINSLNGNTNSDSSSTSSHATLSHDKEQNLNCLQVTQKCTETSKCGMELLSTSTAANQHTIGDVSEEDTYNSWSDTDDFSYFAFGQTQPCDEDTNSMQEEQSLALTVDYLKTPIRTSGVRQLSPIQECPSSRSPSPPASYLDNMNSSQPPKPLSVSEALTEGRSPSSSELYTKDQISRITISQPIRNFYDSNNVPSTTKTSKSSLTEVSCMPISRCHTYDSLDSDSLDDYKGGDSILHETGAVQRSPPLKCSTLSEQLEFGSSSSESDIGVKEKLSESKSDSDSLENSNTYLPKWKPCHSSQSKIIHRPHFRTTEQCQTMCSSTSDGTDTDSIINRQYYCKGRLGHVTSGLFEQMVAQNKRKRRKKKLAPSKNRHPIQKGSSCIYMKPLSGENQLVRLQWNQPLDSDIEQKSPPPLPQPKILLPQKEKCKQPSADKIRTRLGLDLQNPSASAMADNCSHDFKSIMQIAFSSKEDDSESLEQNGSQSSPSWQLKCPTQLHGSTLQERAGFEIIQQDVLPSNTISAVTIDTLPSKSWTDDNGAVWQPMDSTLLNEILPKSSLENTAHYQTKLHDRQNSKIAHAAPASFTADSLEDIADYPLQSNRQHSEMTSWIGTSNDKHVRQHNETSTVASLGGQSWPSCDSLTMVYMGPEWGSTETNIIASIQSIENFDQSESESNSDFASHQSGRSVQCEETSTSSYSAALHPETKNVVPVIQNQAMPCYDLESLVHKDDPHIKQKCFPMCTTATSCLHTRRGQKQFEQPFIMDNVIHTQETSQESTPITSKNLNSFSVQDTPSPTYSSPRYASTPNRWVRTVSSETYTVCAAENSGQIASAWDEQYACVNQGMAEDTFDAAVPLEEAQVDGRHYQDLWTISTYSNDDLGQGLLPPCLCKGLHRAVEASSGNRSTLSTYAEVSTQTESGTDSGIQTQVTEVQRCTDDTQSVKVQLDNSTQTSAVSTQTWTQTGPLQVDVASQTHPISENHTTQTEDYIKGNQIYSRSSKKDVGLQMQIDQKNASVSTDPSSTINRATQVDDLSLGFSTVLKSEESFGGPDGMNAEVESSGPGCVDSAIQVDDFKATTNDVPTSVAENFNSMPVLIDSHVIPVIPLVHILNSQDMAILNQTRPANDHKCTEVQLYGGRPQTQLLQAYQSGFYVGLHGSKDVIHRMEISVTFIDGSKKAESEASVGTIPKTNPHTSDSSKLVENDHVGSLTEIFPQSETLTCKVELAQNENMVLNTGHPTADSLKRMDLERNVFEIKQPTSLISSETYGNSGSQVNDRHLCDQKTFQKVSTVDSSTVNTSKSATSVISGQCCYRTCETVASTVHAEDETCRIHKNSVQKLMAPSSGVPLKVNRSQSCEFLTNSSRSNEIQEELQKIDCSAFGPHHTDDSPNNCVIEDNDPKNHEMAIASSNCYCHWHPVDISNAIKHQSSGAGHQVIANSPMIKSPLIVTEQRCKERSYNPQESSSETTSLCIEYFEDRFKKFEHSMKTAKSHHTKWAHDHLHNENKMSSIQSASQPQISDPYQQHSRNAAIIKQMSELQTRHLKDTDEYLRLPELNSSTKNDSNETQKSVQSNHAFVTTANDGLWSSPHDCQPVETAIGTGPATNSDNLISAMSTPASNRSADSYWGRKCDTNVKQVRWSTGPGSLSNVESAEIELSLDNISHSKCPRRFSYRGRMADASDCLTCTCCTVRIPTALPPLLVPDISSDAEQDSDCNLPKDIIQLLRECRAVRKKAWKEIVLAHEQLQIATERQLHQSCAIHGNVFEEQ